jgi:hypothetical protein
MKINDPATLAEVTAIFEHYEDVLMRNDVAALDLLFWPSDLAVRFGGGGENLYGFDAVCAFRAARVGGAPRRRLTRTVITTFGTDFATASTEFEQGTNGRRGRQMQSWARLDGAWRIVAAHISMTG